MTEGEQLPQTADPFGVEAERLADLAFGRGDLLLALDIVSGAIAAGCAAPGLGYKRVLALARMGDTRRALEEARRIGLAERADEDSLALHARLLKDLAARAPAGSWPELVREARAAYDRAHAVDGGYFSAINAATLCLLAGDEAEARRRAAKLLDDPRIARPADYYAAASRVEALLLLGRADEAGLALDAALAFPDVFRRATGSHLTR